MNELIRIDTSEQGLSVVSALDLYNYLGSKTRFDIWIKRMLAYGFVEGQDYVVTIKNDRNSNGGRQQLQDYALTLDTAKEISMIQRTDKGKEARQYFIDAEKALQGTGQLLFEYAKRINQLEVKLSRVVEAQQQAALAFPALPRSTDELPVETTRMKAKRIVNVYCRATGDNQQKVWRYVYQRLYYLYRIRIRAYKRSERETLLDVADRKGYMDKIYAIVSNELVIP